MHKNTEGEGGPLRKEFGSRAPESTREERESGSSRPTTDNRQLPIANCPYSSLPRLMWNFAV